MRGEYDCSVVNARGEEFRGRGEKGRRVMMMGRATWWTGWGTGRHGLDVRPEGRSK